LIAYDKASTFMVTYDLFCDPTPLPGSGSGGGGGGSGGGVLIR